MTQLETILATDWDLAIKAVSKELTSNIDPLIDAAGHDWILQDRLKAMGHTLSPSNSVKPCWRATRNKMWGGVLRKSTPQTLQTLHSATQNCTYGSLHSRDLQTYLCPLAAAKSNSRRHRRNATTNGKLTHQHTTTAQRNTAETRSTTRQHCIHRNTTFQQEMVTCVVSASGAMGRPPSTPSKPLGSEAPRSP